VDDQEEQAWVERAREGDQKAFAALVDRYWGRIQRWLFSLTRRRHTSEDLTQEVFLKAWSALPALQEDARFRPWLFRIARNCLIDCRRSASNGDVRSLPEDIASSEPEPIHLAVAEESLALVQQACARLPLPYRAALLLWTQEDMSYAEIAQSLNISEGMARWRVCKARQRLLHELGPHLGRR
jgi:RNA polymerase sigma-70 factor, ECF subfamily